MNSGQEIAILSDDNNEVNESDKSPWNSRKKILIQRGSPICRFRTEACWNPHGLANALGASQKWADVFIISIRTIGPRADIKDGSALALVEALKDRNIFPVILQQQDCDHEWRNHWIVHITSQDVYKLPDFRDQHKGIFWNPRNELFFFIWCVVPVEAEDTENMKGRHLKFEAHIPNVHPWTEHVLVGMRKELALHTPCGKNLSIREAKFRGEKIGETIVNSGNFTLTISKLPDDDEFRKFLRTNNRTKFLTAWWKGNEVRLSLDPSCLTCGAEGHVGGGCPYHPKLENLIPQMKRIRSQRDSVPVVKNLEVFNPPSKRKTKSHTSHTSNQSNKVPPDVARAKKKKK